MGKDKERWEGNQIIDVLARLKNYSFEAKNGFLTAAILSMQEKQDFQVRKIAEFLDQIANLFDILQPNTEDQCVTMFHPVLTVIDSSPS